MKKINLRIILFATLVFIIGIILFTVINNDHAECEIILESSTGPTNGEEFSTEDHICRETLNF